MADISSIIGLTKEEEGAILKAIEKFAQRWILTLKENKEKLCYHNLVNYDEFLK